MKLLAVTACPVGIAHTYMAAENLQQAGDEMGIDIKDGIIIASDKDVSKERFIGKKLIVVGVQEGIRNPKELMERFQKEEVPVYKASEMKADNTTKKDDGKEKTPIYRHLMNGVSYMI